MAGTLDGAACDVIGDKFPFFFIALTFSGTKSPFKVRTDTSPSRGERPCRELSRPRREARARGIAPACAQRSALPRRRSRLRPAPALHPNRASSEPPPPQAAAPAAGGQIGTGQVRVGLILPLSAQGNAGVAAQSMKNAAEMALAEFKNPNIQLLVKDDAGTPQGAQAARPAGARRRRRNHHRAAVCASGARGRRGRARARHSGDRVFDRRQRRHQRRLSA